MERVEGDMRLKSKQAMSEVWPDEKAREEECIAGTKLEKSFE